MQTSDEKTFVLLYVPETSEWVHVLFRNHAPSSVYHFSKRDGLKHVTPTKHVRYFEGAPREYREGDPLSFQLDCERIFIASSLGDQSHMVGEHKAVNVVDWDGVPEEIRATMRF